MKKILRKIQTIDEYFKLPLSKRIEIRKKNNIEKYYKRSVEYPKDDNEKNKKGDNSLKR